MSPEAVSPATGRWVALAFFLASFVLFLQENDFPFYYHPDEPTKVAQVVEGTRNFNHPLLMVNSVAVAARLAGTDGAAQPVVEAGRWTAAFYMAGSVALVVLLVFWSTGLVGAVAAGFLLATRGEVFQLAHYFKEDPSLVFGLALTFVAMVLLRARPSVGRFLFLGVAVGLASSSKYIGVVALALALPSVFLARGGLRGLLWVGVAFLLTVAAVNVQIFSGFETFQASFDREAALALKGGVVQKDSIPHFKYFREIRDSFRSYLAPFFIYAFVVAFRCRRSLRYEDWLLLAFPFLYAAFLGFSMKISPRYFLPGTLIIGYLAGIGSGGIFRDLSAWSRVWPRRAIASALVAVALVGGFRSVSDVLAEVGATGRQELGSFVRDTLPPNSVIAQGAGVHLPDRDDPRYAAAPEEWHVPQRIITSKYLQKLGTLDDLRSRGVTHVAVTEHNYKRYLRKGARPRAGREAEFERGRLFFRRLFDEAAPIWESGDKGSKIHRPLLRLYELPD